MADRMQGPPMHSAPKWVVELASNAPQKPKSTSVPDPPGFASSGGTKRGSASKQPPAHKAPTAEQTDTLKLKKAWELAIAPAKSLPMNAVGMYMTGNSLQIFSIMMVFMLFKSPIQALLNLDNTFARYETEGTKQRLWMAKIVFVAMNLLALGLGVWKVNAMGLLPTTRSDWLAWEPQRQPSERAYPDLQ